MENSPTTEPSEEPEQLSTFRELLNRTNIANFCAAFIVIAGLTYGFMTKDTETVKATLLIALGYLFGKSTA